MAQNILVIDDEKAIRKALNEILTFEGFIIDEAVDGAEGAKKIKENNYDCILCDIKMPKMDGMEVLQLAREERPDTPFIVISGHGNIETAVDAVKKGAYDYISKPPDLNRLLITVRNAMDKKLLVAETKQLRKRISRGYEMIGNSEGMLRIHDTIAKVAPTDARVLITGENGVGKELVRDAKYLGLATRICAEMGAHFVKTYFCEKGFARVAAGCPVPLVIAGGKKLPELEALQMAWQAVNEGAAGVDMGRNIFQCDAPQAMIQAVRAVVHGDETPEKAFDLYLSLKSVPANR